MPKGIAIILIACVALVVFSTTLNVIEGRIGILSIIALSFTGLAFANIVATYVFGGYFFSDKEIFIKQGLFRQHVLYTDIIGINTAKGQMSDIELNMGRKNPIAILVKDKSGFLAELYKYRPDLNERN
ncbi:MAG: hypothetical protein FWE33_04370 [Defluviitaleaceae bacterium]|nr:hypothetical protein [Defluviitaleaceae bacterium]